MARFCALFSGSSANSTYIGYGNNGIIIDAGASFASLSSECEKKGISINSISAVFVTHTHSDHIKGLKTLLKKLNIPVIASENTLKTLCELNVLAPNTRAIPIVADAPLEINGVCANFFETSHDSLGSGGYSFLLPGGTKISVCTDLGVITPTVHSALVGSNLVMLESNHDIKMLKNGPYPAELKLRIMGEKGHLSNNICAAELKSLFSSGTNRFVLGHLSRHNNTPLLATAATTGALLDYGAQKGSDYVLNVATPCGNEVIYL